VNKNNIYSSLGPHFANNPYKSVFKSFLLYVAEIVIEKVTIYIIKLANLDNDYLPEPPTPTNKACPEGGSTILQILQTCFKASSNNTNPI